MLAALCWWSILLLKFNEENYQLKQATAQSSTEEISLAEKEYNKQRKMILGEGMVFGIALIVGIYFIYRSYKREMNVTKRQNNFLLSITHELKSPLSVVKLINQTLQKRNLNKEQQTELLSDGETEILRLENLISNLLLTTKLDDYAGNFEETELSSLIQERVDIYNKRYKDRIIFSQSKKFNLALDKELFSTAIDNLISNALKYSGEQTKVKIDINASKKHTSISISDVGKGITDLEKEKVFTKFYRSGDEETRNSQGSGLGLYLVKEIIKLHNGSISIKDNHPKGSTFLIILDQNK
jgi:K+-sensing histidine kinase KdpD